MSCGSSARKRTSAGRSVLCRMVNIDRLSLTKSSEVQFCPILRSIFAVENSDIVVVGIYHGIKKTFSVNDFFAHLVAEATTLEKEGFVSYGKTFSVASYGLLCNMPARGFVISVKEHIRGSHIVKARFYGCHKYETKGTS